MNVLTKMSATLLCVALTLGSVQAQDAVVIGPENVGSLTLIDQLGDGFVRDGIAWSADETTLIAASSIGVMTIDPGSQSIRSSQPVEGGGVFKPYPAQERAISLMEGAVLLTDTRTGQLIARFEDSFMRNPIQATLRPDGLQLAARSFDGKVRVWSVDAPDEAPSLLETQLSNGASTVPETTVVYSADSSVLAIGGGREVIVLDAHSLEEQRRVTMNAEIFALALSPDGQTLYAGTLTGAVEAWPLFDASLPAQIWPTGSRIVALRASADGSALVGVTEDQGMWHWPLDAPDQAVNHPIFGQPSDLAVSADGWRAAVTSFGQLGVYDMQYGGESVFLPAPSAQIYSLHANPAANQVLVRFSGGIVSQLWPLDGGDPVGLEGTPYDQSMSSFAFTPDGQTAASMSNIWLEDDRWALGIGLWDTSTGARTGSYEFPQQETDGVDGLMEGVAISPDGRWLLVGRHGGMINLLDAVSGDLLTSFQAHQYSVLQMRFSPDSTRLATLGSYDEGTAKLWDMTTLPPIELASISIEDADLPTSLDFSPSGDQIAVGTRLLASVRVWDVATGELLPPDQGFDASAWDNLVGTTYSPDGRLVAAIADQFDFETHVLVWDTETRELLLDLTTPAGAAAIDFNADGTRLVVGMINGIVGAYGVE